MTTYYVRKTGNDTTGNGSDATPWLTVSKAVLTVPIAGGHTVKIGDGTYQEDTSSLGYLYVARLFLAEVIFESESGLVDNVIIQNLSATTYELRITGASNVTFRNVSFIPRLVTNLYTFRDNDGSLTNVHFDGCKISAEANNGYCVSISVATGKAVSGLWFTNCTFIRTGANITSAVNVTTVGTGTVDGLAITGCTMVNFNGLCIHVYRQITNLTISNTVALNSRDTVACVEIDGCVGATITNLTATATGNGSIALLVGADAETGNPSSGIVILGGSFISTQAHALLIGAAVDGCTVDNVYARGFDCGIVLKACNHTVVTACSIYHDGASGAMYFKGAQNSTFQNCICTLLAGKAMYINIVGATKVVGCSYLRNKIYVSGTGALYDWDIANDGNGNISNYNIYRIRNGGWGQIRGTAITNLKTARAAWVGYGAGNNDLYSRLFGSNVVIMHKR